MLQQELYHKIFGSNEAGISYRERLKEVTNEFPYFSAAHFFLLKETLSTDFNYRKIAAKTAIHFNNPYLLKYQLYKKEPVINVNEIKPADKIDEVNQSLLKKVVQPEEDITFAEPEIITVPPTLTENTNTDPEQTENKTIIIKEEFLFEPLYSTDYFASQGIKLSEEVQPDDKLGKQLRSFTDWLKTMKKVQHGKLPDAGQQIDLAVQNLAEKSNKEQEIITEYMAEVYAGQGKTAKATDVYKKLSLLNPAKSAYFAAKIDLLKEK